MAGRQAKILSDGNTSRLLLYASRSRYPRRNRVVVLLSVKAGLRAGEIAKLTWDMVVDATGEIGTIIELQDRAAAQALPGAASDMPASQGALHQSMTARSHFTPEREKFLQDRRGLPGNLSHLSWTRCAKHIPRSTSGIGALSLIRREYGGVASDGASGLSNDKSLNSGHSWAGRIRRPL